MSNDNGIRVQVSSRAKDSCGYRFQLDIRSTCKITEGTITFNIDSEFTSLKPVSCTGNIGILTFDGQVGTWDLTGVNRKMGRTIFTAAYNGSTVGERTVISDIKYNSECGSETVADNYAVNIEEVCSRDIRECCEQCPNSNNYVEAVVRSCTDNTTVQLDDFDIESTGRVLAVNVSLPPACDNKDVNVGIFVNEVMLDEDENEVEVPFAYKVIRIRASNRPRNSCRTGRGCRCVEFMIDDDTPQCESRTFRIRTKAHYVSTTNPRCNCECNE